MLEERGGASVSEGRSSTIFPETMRRRRASRAEAMDSSREQQMIV